MNRTTVMLRRPSRVPRSLLLLAVVIVLTAIPFHLAAPGLPAPGLRSSDGIAATTQGPGANGDPDMPETSDPALGTRGPRPSLQDFESKIGPVRGSLQMLARLVDLARRSAHLV